MPGVKPVLGILGAGRLGVVLAQLASGAGYPVLIAGSGDPKRIALPQDALRQGAVAMTSVAAAEQADVVILALPLPKFREVPAEPLAGKTVIDAMNYWWEADGLIPEFRDPIASSSEIVQKHLSASRIVKAFNHMGYADLADESRPRGTAHRKAIGIAGDHTGDLEVVAGIVDDLGFDPVRVGVLADGVTLEPGTEPFGADVGADELRAMVERFPTSQRGLRRAAALAARSATDPARSTPDPANTADTR